MLKSLFIFILFLILSIVGIVGIVAYKVFNLVRNMKTASKGGKQTWGFDDGTFRGQRTTNTSNGDTIIDTRDPHTANRKIIPADEGEYVDYTE